MAEGRAKKTSRVNILGGAKEGNRIVMKLCIEVGVHDVITHANLCDDRSGVSEGAENEFPPFH